MQRIFRLFFILAALSFSSCQKVIDIKLRQSDVKYVVEGIITNEPVFCKVYLSQTKPFDEDNQFTWVSGATVTVKDNGTSVPLTETQPGGYETNLIHGTPGHLYQLIVKINEKVFEASCTMPQPVSMDTLYIELGPFGQFNFANIRFTDPAGIQNWYRFLQYINGRKDPFIFWERDEFTEGQQVELLLDNGVTKKDDPFSIKSGDEVTIEMLCLDEDVYKYWYSLRTDGGDGSSNSVAPANPLTNINGGALGYFSAHTVHRKKVIAP
jgi:hypothetical protein